MKPDPVPSAPYRGRLAPSPTGLLHVGHARTFWIAQTRCLAQNGHLILRNDDLDAARCQPRFVDAMFEDLRWLGLLWQEGPDAGGAFGPYTQSQRMEFYRATFEELRREKLIYPCTCSRQDVLRAVQAPHAGEDEPLYPGTCRPRSDAEWKAAAQGPTSMAVKNCKINWRFHVPDGSTIAFRDGFCGPQKFLAGVDFGDFVVWRHDGLPSYQLATTVDDAAMKITEVVRGQDLLRSTARQILLYAAIKHPPPAFYHCELLRDANGQRLAKRHDSLSLQSLRRQGKFPQEIIAQFKGQETTHSK